MSRIDCFRQQYPWRPWAQIDSLLGDLTGQVVLDPGCGIDDQPTDLARPGASVVDIDADEELVAAARARRIPRARFVSGDLASFAPDSPADGLWSSFSIACFPAMDETVRAWSRWLVPGGWMCVTELDDLFGHEPLPATDRELAGRYYAQSLEERPYVFRSRERLRAAVLGCGCTIEAEREFDDRELAFDGPASDDVLASWRIRLDFMMPRFTARFGEQATGFAEAMLRCLESAEHRSRARVWTMVVRCP